MFMFLCLIFRRKSWFNPSWAPPHDIHVGKLWIIALNLWDQFGKFLQAVRILLTPESCTHWHCVLNKKPRKRTNWCARFTCVTVLLIVLLSFSDSYFKQWDISYFQKWDMNGLVLLYYCIIVLLILLYYLYYCSTVLLYYCITCITVLLVLHYYLYYLY